MSLILGRKSFLVLSLVILFVLSFSIVPQGVLAHGGEDHGDQQPATAQTSANMTVRVAGAGDYEITFKHPNLEPDKELTARIFVTRYENNEPVKGAKVLMLIASGNSAATEISATETDTPGFYEVKLPPMTQGDYKFSTSLNVSGSSLMAEFGAVEVKMPAVETTADGTSIWARAALIVFGILMLLVLLGALLFISLRYGRQQQRTTQVKEETATA